MRIIFVRHGHPNYELDCLTPLGKLQAQAVAERLKGETVHRICSSTKGRALETAQPIAEMFGLEIEKYDFMREIGWGETDVPLYKKGHPWLVADHMVELGQSTQSPIWAQEEPYLHNRCVSFVQDVGKNFDAWLEPFGYIREGDYYRVQNGSKESVIMVSHGGSSTAALSRLLNLPFPYLCAVLKPGLTGITTISLNGNEGDLICPHIDLLNDCRHIRGIETPNVIEQ